MPYDNRSSHYGRSRHGDHREQTPRLDEGLMKFYDEKNETKVELFDTNAEKIADFFSKARKEVNSYTQLRRFYDEVVDLHERIEENPSLFTQLLPLIRMLNAKTAYAKGRNKVDDNFVLFVKESLSQVKTAKDFTVFKTLFEAVMGFYKSKRSN